MILNSSPDKGLCQSSIPCLRLKLKTWLLKVNTPQSSHYKEKDCACAPPHRHWCVEELFLQGTLVSSAKRTPQYLYYYSSLIFVYFWESAFLKKLITLTNRQSLPRTSTVKIFFLLTSFHLGNSPCIIGF